MFSKHRLEALSDGIFAIVMTLLILDIKVPQGIPHGELGHALRAEGPTWISFLVTFILAARYWVLQHKLFAVMEHMRARAVVMTFVFLGLVTVLPFSTSLWGHHLTEGLAFTIYFGNQMLMGLVLVVELEFALREAEAEVPREIELLRWRLWTTVGAMFAAMLSSWLLPLQYVGIVVAGVAGGSRRIRKWLQRNVGAAAKA